MSWGLTKKEAKISAILVCIILLEKVFSFAKNIVFAYFFGAQNSTDLYYLATNIVSLFNICFCVSVPMAFLTFFINKGYREAEPAKQTEVMSNVTSAFLGLAFLFTAILFVIAPLLERIIAPTDSLNVNDRLSVYVRILSFIVILYCFSGLFSSSLECLGNYIPTKLSSLFVSAFAVLAAALFGKKYGTIVAVYGFLAGIGCHALFAFILLWRKRKIRLKLPKLDDSVKSVLYLSLPMMVGVAATSINSLVDKLIAVKIGEGVVSALNYSSLLSRELVTGVLVAAVSSIITARFSENILHKEYDALNSNMNVIIFVMSLAVIPLTIFYFGYADQIISFIFERGAFKESAKDLTTMAFLGYSVGLIFLPFREVFIRVQYAYQDSKKPMVISLISVLLNMILSVVLGVTFGIIGIAIATSVATIANCVLSYVAIKRKKIFEIKINWLMYGKLLISSAVTVAIMLLIKNIPFKNNFIELLLSGVLILGCFLGISCVLNRKLVRTALKVLSKKS